METWMVGLDYGKQLRQAIIDCPDNLSEGMADMRQCKNILDVMDDMQELEMNILQKNMMMKQ